LGWKNHPGSDGTLIAYTSEDHSIKLLSKQEGKLLNSLQGRSGTLKYVAFSLDGLLVVSGSVVGMIRLWQASDGYR